MSGSTPNDAQPGNARSGQARLHLVENQEDAVTAAKRLSLGKVVGREEEYAHHLRPGPVPLLRRRTASGKLAFERFNITERDQFRVRQQRPEPLLQNSFDMSESAPQVSP